MAMDQVVVGIIPTYSEALRAVHELRAAGFAEDVISVAARHPDVEEAQAKTEADEDRQTSSLETAPAGGTAAGAATGGVLGGVGGLLAGLGALLIPGIGPIVAAGPLAGALGGAALGAATGGFVGALVDMGVPEEHAHEYHRRFEQGGVIVTVRADDESADDAATILRRYEAVPTPSA